MGQPLNLGVALDKQVQSYLLAAHEGGGSVMPDLAITVGTGLVRKKDSNLLAKKWGTHRLNSRLGAQLAGPNGFCEEKDEHSKVKVLVEDFEKLKSQFLFDIETFTSLEKIPKSLVFNWNQTAIRYVPVPDWTMDKKETKKVKLAGLDDK